MLLGCRNRGKRRRVRNNSRKKTTKQQSLVQQQRRAITHTVNKNALHLYYNTKLLAWHTNLSSSYYYYCLPYRNAPRLDKPTDVSRPFYSPPAPLALRLAYSSFIATAPLHRSSLFSSRSTARMRLPSLCFRAFSRRAASRCIMRLM